MPVPNSLPVSLSSVVSEFGGTGGPRNLGAYKAGAGYTPLGAKGGSAAIPTPNGNIPSASPLNLGSFPGAKKELSVTNYWPYKDYFHRNFFYYNSNPPQTIANNTDATNQYNSSHNAGYISASQVAWQKKTFNNMNNASLPDSGQCTVVFMVAGSAATYTNTMSGGTSLSVRALDPSGVEMHMSPVAYGKYNFVTGSGTSTTSEIALVWASYNCSIKKITTVCTGIYPNGSNTASDELLILPGLKKVKEYVVTRDNTGYDIKPTNPIAPDEVVFGMKYDGGGDYEIQYTNQTFPNWLRSSNWWYNQVGFDIEANVGTSSVALTTTCPQDYTPANVWCVFNENTATVYSQGVNPVWGTLSIASANSSFTLKRNGSVTAIIGGNALDLPTYPSCPESWYMGLTGNNWPGDGYWALITVANGSVPPTTGQNGVWVPLSSNQTWGYTGSGSNCVVTVDIATDSSGSNIKRLGTVVLATASSGGGGGGGGGCVAIDSFLPANYKQAMDVQAGDMLQLADDTTLEFGSGMVTYSEMKTELGFRITTESGISLKCSVSAPIPTLENGYKTPRELLFEKVPTRRDVNGEIVTAWEQIVSVVCIGEIAVQHITVGDKCFWAGEQKDAYILHHNLKDIQHQNEV